jgi:hypothetical protein
LKRFSAGARYCCKAFRCGSYQVNEQTAGC